MRRNRLGGLAKGRPVMRVVHFFCHLRTGVLLVVLVFCCVHNWVARMLARILSPCHPFSFSNQLSSLVALLICTYIEYSTTFLYYTWICATVLLIVNWPSDRHTWNLSILLRRVHPYCFSLPAHTSARLTWMNFFGFFEFFRFFWIFSIPPRIKQSPRRVHLSAFSTVILSTQFPHPKIGQLLSTTWSKFRDSSCNFVVLVFIFSMREICSQELLEFLSIKNTMFTFYITLGFFLRCNRSLMHLGSKNKFPFYEKPRVLLFNLFLFVCVC